MDDFFTLDFTDITDFFEELYGAVVTLVNCFVDFLRSVVAFWNTYGPIIQDAIKSVKVFVRNVEDLVARIYVRVSDNEYRVYEDPKSVSIMDVPASLQNALNIERKAAILHEKEEELIRERFA